MFKSVRYEDRCFDAQRWFPKQNRTDNYYIVIYMEMSAKKRFSMIPAVADMMMWWLWLREVMPWWNCIIWSQMRILQFNFATAGIENTVQMKESVELRASSTPCLSHHFFFSFNFLQTIY